MFFLDCRIIRNTIFSLKISITFFSRSYCILSSMISYLMNFKSLYDLFSLQRCVLCVCVCVCVHVCVCVCPS